MTPEHVDSLMNDYVFPLPETMMGIVPSIRRAILAACAEQDRESRYAALTEAAEACVTMGKSELTKDEGYACGIRDCIALLMQIRDKP